MEQVKAIRAAPLALGGWRYEQKKTLAKHEGILYHKEESYQSCSSFCLELWITAGKEG